MQSCSIYFLNVVLRAASVIVWKEPCVSERKSS